MMIHHIDGKKAHDDPAYWADYFPVGKLQPATECDLILARTSECVHVRIKQAYGTFILCEAGDKEARFENGDILELRLKW